MYVYIAVYIDVCVCIHECMRVCVYATVYICMRVRLLTYTHTILCSIHVGLCVVKF